MKGILEKQFPDTSAAPYTTGFHICNFSSNLCVEPCLGRKESLVKTRFHLKPKPNGKKKIFKKRKHGRSSGRPGDWDKFWRQGCGSTETQVISTQICSSLRHVQKPRGGGPFGSTHFYGRAGIYRA